MAQQTELSVMGIPGMVHSFVAKEGIGVATVTTRYNLIGIDNQSFALMGTSNQNFPLIGIDNQNFPLIGA
ncbi:hypothetical protein LCGC14_0909090 [marine sediment metagenome]|uniref:Uncharacterized protein n=1 Tax=marine sediment metagenome TaxID=412755 RepID=A0A0F9S0Z9_9ZZZZ